MKKLYNILICTAAVAALTSCEKFFTREPINEFSAETYFASESEMKMYTDGMLNAWLPDYTETSSGDAYNDLIGTKTSSDFFRADVQWNRSKQGTSWSWTFARRCNYMLERMEANGKGKVADDVYNHYRGLALFWRSYNYISRVKTWSNVPWIDKYLQPTDSLLYGPREDREYVMHNVIQDVLFACQNVKAGTIAASTKNQVNKYVVNALASRWFLYEATYRMNHATNPATGQPWNNKYETPQQLLQYAADAAKVVIESGKYSLTSSYPDIFLSTELNDDVIWGQIFILESNGRHAYTRYFNSSTLGQQYSGTKDLMLNFLKTDGTPVENGYQSINDEFKGRDPRLAATVLGPDRIVKDLNGNMINPSMNWTFTKTGYMLVKWCIPDETHYQNSIDENCIPVLRYAEVLLNYAEAMNELGQFNQDIWNTTVGALRQRAGVASIYPTTPDTYLKDYYMKDVTHGTTEKEITNGNLAVALEIRRERVTELTFESDLRQNDLYRWAQCDLIERRYNHVGWAGLWVSADEAKNGFEFSGRTYTFDSKQSNTETNYPTIDTDENLNWSLEKAGSGYYLVYKYKLKWEERMYVRPLCVNDPILNPNLVESYGWEDAE